MINTEFYLSICITEKENFDISLISETVLFKPTNQEFSIIDFDQDEVEEFIDSDSDRLSIRVSCLVPTKHFQWTGKSEYGVDEWNGEMLARCTGFLFDETSCSFMKECEIDLEFDEDENNEVFEILANLIY